MDDSATDVSRANYVKREIMWKYYTPDIPKLEAACKICDNIVICKGGSTESMTNHLKYWHDIIIDKLYEELEHELNVGAKENVEGNRDSDQGGINKEAFELGTNKDNDFPNDNQKRPNNDDILYMGKSVGFFPPQQGIKQENTNISSTVFGTFF